MNGKKLARGLTGASLLSLFGIVGSLEVGRLTPGTTIIAAAIALTVLTVSVVIGR